ncbi:MAG TPA: hypothetical protein VIT67_11740, partial [Povalibacter sp.]
MQNHTAVAPVILAVAIDTPLRRLFDYRSPAEAGTDITPGHRVWVPFGRRRVVGVVVECRPHSTVPIAKLRSAHGLVDTDPTFDASFLELLRWSADYYRHPVGEVITAALPAALRQGAPLKVDEIAWRLTAAGREHALAGLPARATQLRAAVAALAVASDVGSTALIRSGIARDALRKLAERGYAEHFVRSVADVTAGTYAVRDDPPLNESQGA